MLLPAFSRRHLSPRLRGPLLTSALALVWASVANAQVLWEDGFEGPELDPAWQVTTQNVSSWSGGFSGGAWHLQTIQGQQNNSWCEVILGRDLPCLDGLLITADMAWSGTSIQVMQQALLQLRDSDGDILARGGLYDAWVGHRGAFYGCVGSSCQQQAYGSQPVAGELVIQVTLQEGVYSLLLDGTPYATGSLPMPAARLEIAFSHYEYLSSTFGGTAISNLRLESALSAPLVSIQADSSLVLQWPAQHCSPVRIYEAPSLESLWPGGYTLLAEAPAGTDHWPLPAPAPDSHAVYRLTRVLE